MKRRWIRAAAAIIALCCAASALPVIPADAEIVEEAKVVYETDFEDGDVSKFSPRGDRDTSVIKAEKDEEGTYMSITERSNGWNGPQIKLDDICEPGVRYAVSLRAKAAWYNDIKVSLQYTPNGSEDAVYSNLQSKTSQGEWVTFEDVKLSFSEDVHDVFLYIEASDKVDLCMDDFSLKTTPVYGMEKDIPGLKDVYKDYFKIGGAVTADELSPQSTKDLILKHYNSITLGNELKPENMLDKEACQKAAADDETAVAVSLKGNARSILNFCRDNKIPVRGHVLVWHSQTPGWFFKKGYDPDAEWVDKETMLGRMENYIKNVMAVLDEEYPDVDFYAWDVVNEAFTDDGKPRKAGTYEESGEYSGWVGVFGDNSFIPYAFEYARKYARKGTKLYYNDFNEYMQGKRNAIAEMATELHEKGVLDGIGMQSHLDVRTGSDAFPSVNVYEAALKKFAETGVDVQITELDATLPKNQPITPELLEAQAQYYSDIMDAIVKYKDNVSAVVFWGTTDDCSWRAWGSPLLFNEDYTAKPCFKSIIDGIDYTIEETPTEETQKPTEEQKETTPPQTETQPDTSGSKEIPKEFTGKIVSVGKDSLALEDQTFDGTCVWSEDALNTLAELKEGDSVVIKAFQRAGNGVLYIVSVTKTSGGESSEGARKQGDVNGDSDVNILDVIAVNKFLVGAKTLDEAAMKAGDINASGEPDSEDSLAILKMALNIVK
ncbi:MAG: endo-1,4-beta-xylanase [Oscillospiraceae bacterium]|nr:endo-1,4-beta-xylanase [Oscillospiraceae bacterium]